jgi:N-acetylmuramoyl-L-alanine amidase
MSVSHIVQQGDSVASLAEQYGHFVHTIWDADNNATLKAQRRDMNVLLPGDVVWIPDVSVVGRSCEIGKRHVFRRKGVPAALRLQLMRNGNPRADLPYRLTIGDTVLKGKTDAQGRLHVFVSPQARDATLYLGTEEERVQLQLGAMDPEDSPSGIEKRLINLGYLTASAAESPDDGTRLRGALRQFQADRKLDITGEADAATRASLVSTHDVGTR